MFLDPNLSLEFRTDANPGSADKVAPVVFNLETGEAEDVPKPLAGVAEEDEKSDE